MGEHEEIRTFFATLYPDLGGQWLLLWRLPEKASLWVQAVTDDVVAQIHRWSQQFDVYVGCGLAPYDHGPYVRCHADTVTGIPGLWLDVDYGPGHKKRNLPETQEDAMGLIDSMGPAPTLILHSGHGLQAWWAFKEPWIFESDEERTQAMALCAAWSRTLMAKAQAKGWTADNVGDLSRVMRIPGTWNRKSVEVKTKLLKLTDYRWNPTDFDQYFDARAEVPEATGNLHWSFSLSGTANPPPKKFALLFDSEPKFQGSWNHARKMDSASEYDLSLATLAMSAGWGAQEIVDLLIAHRREYHEDLKLREDYYTRTLNKAAQAKVTQERETLIEAFQSGQDVPDRIRKDPAEMKAFLSRVLGVPIGRMVKYLTDPPDYRLEVNGQMYQLGKIAMLDDQRLFRRFLMDYARERITPQKGEQWHKISQYLLDICEEVHVDRFDEQFSSWLAQYFEDLGIKDEAEWETAMLASQPFRKNGHCYLTVKGLKKYLWTTWGEKWERRDLKIRLKSLGAECLSLSTSHRNYHTSRSVWKLPE